MKATISGYFGLGNIGDEAILEAMVLGLKTKWPLIEITVLSSDPEKTAKTYGVLSSNRMNISEVISAVSSCDMLISGGGGLIQDVTGFFTAPYYLGIIYLAKIFGKMVVVMGQGFGPVRNPINKLLARWILNKADLIIMRDEKSSSDIISLGVKKPPIHVAGDLTGILPLPKPEKSEAILAAEGIVNDGRPLVGISIRRPSKRIPKRRAQSYYRTIASVADNMVEKFKAKLVFIPFHYPSDIMESAKIINLMRNPVNIILREYTPEDILGIISRTQMFIGMRLHSLIFSAMVDIPMVGIAYDPKVRAFLRLIDQKWIDVEDVNEMSLMNAVEATWREREGVRERLSSWGKDLYIKAKLNFEILGSFLKSISVRDVLGIKFDSINISEAVEKIDEFLQTRSPHLVVTPNPEIIMALRKDEDLRDVINGSSLRLPDGIGVLWASKVLKAPLKERVTGIDLTVELASLAARKGYRIYLVGSKPGVADGAAEYLVGKFPRLKIVGTYHGYFTEKEEQKILDNIRSLKPDILFVGLGSPKQEKWTAQNLQNFGAPVCLTIGGSMDVLSGRVKRAPAWMRRSGLEWLYRMMKEPWRWRRQIILVKFVILVIFTRLFRKKRT